MESQTNSQPDGEELLEQFLTFGGNLVLDNGEHWEPEQFQIEFARDVFAGHKEVWLILPQGNGKTTLLAAIALFHALATPDAMVPIGAASRDQCQILHNQAAGFVRRSPGLSELFKIFDGYREIRCIPTRGCIKVFAADERTGDGIIPTLCLLDELHRHRDLRLYRTWQGKLDKRGGQIIAISTAGEPNTEFEEVRSTFRTQADSIEEFPGRIRAVGAGLVLHDWHVVNEDDVHNMEIVKLSNPLPSKTIEILQAVHDSPTVKDSHWKRFNCNIATRVEGDGISPSEWDACRENGLVPDPSAWCMGGLDLAWDIDTSAVVVLSWESDTRRVVAEVRVFKPEPIVQEADVVDALVQLQMKYRPQGWVFDPHTGGRQMAQMLSNGEHPRQGEATFNFIEHPQDPTPMALAASRLDETIRNRWLVHDGNKDLRHHALSAIRKKVGSEKYRYNRPPDAKGERRQKYPNDLLIALAMANSVAVDEHDKPNAPILIFGNPR